MLQFHQPLIYILLAATGVTLLLKEWIDAFVIFGVVVIGELFYLLNCRSLSKSMFTLGVFSNRWLISGVLIMIGLQMLFTYSPAMNRFFHSAPISLNAWVRIVLIGLLIYVIMEVEKWIRSWFLNRKRP